MGWPLISPEIALEILSLGAVGLDVRSPLEFNKGHLPGFCNLPILHDTHRHLVGLKYKVNGQGAAIQLGHELVEPFKEELIAQWRQELSLAPPDKRVIICWRGGLRSQIAADWLMTSGEEGLRVEGGYKALRAVLLKRFAAPPPLVLLSGMTGSGKTELLRMLPPDRVIDLEAMAEHRGSAFGAHHRHPQPAQQTFENRLAMALGNGVRLRVVENESFLIGTCALPEVFRRCMRDASLIVLEAPMHERVRRIFEEYVVRPLALMQAVELEAELQKSLARIERRLGGLRTSTISTLLRAAFAEGNNSLDRHTPWIETLLREYYDPSYEHGAISRRQILFRGDANAVREFLSNHLDRWRS